MGAGLLLALCATGCKQGEGDRCQLDSDCSSGLRCCYASDNPSQQETIAGGTCELIQRCTKAAADGGGGDGGGGDGGGDAAGTDGAGTDGSGADATTDTSVKPDQRPPSPDTRPPFDTRPPDQSVLPPDGSQPPAPDGSQPPGLDP